MQGIQWTDSTFAQICIQELATILSSDHLHFIGLATNTKGQLKLSRLFKCDLFCNFQKLSRGDLKRMLNEYQRALKDLNKTNVLEPNNASTLSSSANVKYMLHDYQGALEDLDK
ncbi:unnamed protein product, partial [Sphagnum jensenii]